MTYKELEKLELDRNIKADLNYIDITKRYLGIDNNMQDISLECLFEDHYGDVNRIQFRYEEDEIITHDMIKKAINSYLNSIKSYLNKKL